MADLSAVTEQFKSNIARATASEDGAPNPDQKMKLANDFMGGLEAGWDMSVTGLALERPDVMLPLDASRSTRIAAGIAQFTGDIPAMVEGFVGGAILAPTPVTAPIAGAAGAFAFPAAMRKILMDHYDKGDINTFGEFWDRSSSVLWETVKGATTGVATTMAGGVVAKGLAPVAAPIVTKLGTAMSEIATMTTVGNALEGKIPDANDFIDAAIVIGGIHAVTMAPKLRHLYAERGILPEDAPEMAQQDPILNQEIASNNMLPENVEMPSEVAEPPGRTDAETKVLESIGENAKQEKKYTFKDFYRDIVDKLNPIKESEANKDLPADKSGYKLSRMADDYKAKTLHALDFGPMDYENPAKVVGKGFREILSKVKDDLDGFRSYIVAKRAIEIEKSGRTSGVDLDAAKEVAAAGKDKYDAVHKELVEFQAQNLKYLKDSGRISASEYAAMLKMGKSYIPFARILEGAGSDTGSSGGLKRLKGSEAKIQDPLISIVENTEAIYKMAETNRAKAAIVKNAMPGTIEKVKDPKRPVYVTGDEIKRILEDQGAITTFESVKREMKARGLEVTDEQIEAALEKEEDIFSEEINGARVYRKMYKPLAADQFEVYKDGKRTVYRTTDPNLAETINSLNNNTAAQNVILNLARAFTTVKRVTISNTLEFITKNFIRDQVTAGTMSQYGTVPFIDVIHALGDRFLKNENYQAWLRSGGAQGSFLELSESYLGKAIPEINKQTGFLDKTLNVVKAPWELLKVAGEIVEQAPRIAEFKKAYKQSGNIFEGGFASRESTIDFQRKGAQLSALNSITAFQGVVIQGADRMARAAKADPVGTGKRVAVMVAAPSILLWMYNNSNEKTKRRYQEIPHYKRMLGWPIITDKWEVAKTEDESSGVPDYLLREGPNGTEINRGTIYWVPKPEIIGFVGSGIEMALDKYTADNPGEGEELIKTFFKSMIPNMIPDIAAPVLEHMIGKSLFTGRPIVPEYLQGGVPALEYTEYTSETSKALGKMLGAIPLARETSFSSPMYLDNYVRGWAGEWGQYALKLADTGLVATGAVDDPVKPAWTLADIPAIKAFVIRYPSAAAQSIRDFYEQTEKYAQAAKSFKREMKRGDIENADYVAEEYGMPIDPFQKQKEALGTMSQFIRTVAAQKDWTPAEKRQLIDTTYYQMIEISKMGLGMVREMEKQEQEQ